MEWHIMKVTTGRLPRSVASVCLIVGLTFWSPVAWTETEQEQNTMNTIDAEYPTFFWRGHLTETRITVTSGLVVVKAMAQLNGSMADHVFEADLASGEAQALTRQAQESLTPTETGLTDLSPTFPEGTKERALQDDVARISHLAFAQAQALWLLAQSLPPETGDRDALTALDAGLETLGTLYVSDGMIDGTRIKLMLAEQNQASDALPTARGLKTNVLSSRLQVYRDAHGLTAE